MAVDHLRLVGSAVAWPVAAGELVVVVVRLRARRLMEGLSLAISTRGHQVLRLVDD